MKKMLVFLVLGCVVFFATAEGRKEAQKAEFPLEKPIKLVIPYGAGGGVDISARILSAVAPELINQRVDVICMPGAGGQEGINYVMSQPADGYTLLVTDYGPLITTALTEKVGYDLADWKPVFQITQVVPTFFARSDSPVKTVDQWVKALKEKPESLSIAHGRYLSVPHLPLILFESIAGIKNVHVPTSGGSEALSFVLGKKVNLGASVPSTIASGIKSGDLIAIAVASSKRVPSLPNTPTMKEAGYDVSLPAWYTIFAYKGVPEDRINFLHKKFTEALSTSSGKSLAKQASVDITLFERPELQKIYDEPIKSLREILKLIGKIK